MGSSWGPGWHIFWCLFGVSFSRPFWKALGERFWPKVGPQDGSKTGRTGSQNQFGPIKDKMLKNDNPPRFFADFCPQVAPKTAPQTLRNRLRSGRANESRKKGQHDAEMGPPGAPKEPLKRAKIVPENVLDFRRVLGASRRRFRWKKAYNINPKASDQGPVREPPLPGTPPLLKDFSPRSNTRGNVQRRGALPVIFS